MAVWEFEPGHTSAEFAVRHMMVTIVRGHFKNLKGRLHFDRSDPAGCSVDATIDAASFSTEEPQRDAHLRSADFLDVANYPTINFKSTSVEATGTNHCKVAGHLTIRGVTRPVTLDVEYFGPVDTPFNNTRMGFLAKTRIDRYEFGVSWNSPMPDGGWVVGKEVEITLDAEAIRVSE
jgi:polyisoprenoid-binding protein YceI